MNIKSGETVDSFEQEPYRFARRLRCQGAPVRSSTLWTAPFAFTSWRGRAESPVEIIPSRDGELKARNFDVAPQTAIEFNRLVAEQKDVDDLQPGPRLFAEALDLLVSSYDGQYDSAILSKPLGPVDYRRRKQFRLSRGRWKRLNLLIANQISGVEPRPTSRLIAEALNLLFEKYHKEPIA